MTEELTSGQIRKLKGLAQRLEPNLKLGKNGLSEGFLGSLNAELARHELVKVKFADLKDQKKELAPQLAERSQATLVTLVGNVAVLFRRNEDPEKRKVEV